MGPITTCWDLKEIGGSRTTAMRIKKEKLTETRWEGFINNQSTATGAKHGRRMTPQQQRSNRATVHRRRLSHPRVSVTSVNSLTSSQSQINLPGPHATPRKESTIPEESDEVSIAPTETTDEEDAGGYSKGRSSKHSDWLNYLPDMSSESKDNYDYLGFYFVWRDQFCLS